LINDISIIFDFAGTVGCTFISFYFPSIGYILALKRYGTDRINAKWNTTVFKTLAYIFIVIGTLALTSYIYTSATKIMGKGPSEEAVLPVVV